MRVPAGLKKSLVEDRLAIDVRQWSRAKLLRPGSHFSVEWSHYGVPFARGDVRVEVDAVRVTLAPPGGSELTRDCQWLSLVWTVCRLTSCSRRGCRVWFRCPLCDRHVAVLYSGDRVAFGCRKCRGLAYASQSESRQDRILERARAARRKLGGGINLSAPLPPRPRGMHRRTYNRLFGKALLAAERQLAALGRGLPSGGLKVDQDDGVLLADLRRRRKRLLVRRPPRVSTRRARDGQPG